MQHVELVLFCPPSRVCKRWQLWHVYSSVHLWTVKSVLVKHLSTYVYIWYGTRKSPNNAPKWFRHQIKCAVSKKWKLQIWLIKCVCLVTVLNTHSNAQGSGTLAGIVPSFHATIPQLPFPAHFLSLRVHLFLRWTLQQHHIGGSRAGFRHCPNPAQHGIHDHHYSALPFYGASKWSLAKANIDRQLREHPVFSIQQIL